MKSAPQRMGPENLDALPIYRWQNAEQVYSKSGIAKTFKDSTGKYWDMLQRPDGSYCRAPVDE